MSLKSFVSLTQNGNFATKTGWEATNACQASSARTLWRTAFCGIEAPEMQKPAWERRASHSGRAGREIEV